MHVYIAIDESGDLGDPKKPNSSRYFVVAGLLFRERDEQKVKRIIKRAREKIGKKKKELPELKATKVPNKIRRFVINQLYKIDSVYLSAVYIDKHNTYERIINDSKQKMRHYNWLIRNLLLDSIEEYLSKVKYSDTFSLTISAYLDRMHTQKMRRANLYEYLSGMLHAKFPYADVRIYQKDSIGEPIIQVTDFVSNTFYRRLTVKDPLLDLFFKKERVLLFKKMY